MRLIIGPIVIATDIFKNLDCAALLNHHSLDGFEAEAQEPIFVGYDQPPDLASKNQADQ